MKTKSLKSHLLVAFLCVVVLFVSFACFSKTYAADTGDYEARIGETYYQSYKIAWFNANMTNNSTITMLKNWDLDLVLQVSEGTNITIDMNGHMINRGLFDPTDSGEVFVLRESSTLTLNNQNNDTEHVGTIVNGRFVYQASGEGVCKINGALITGGYNDDGGGAIHIQDGATLNVNNVTIAGNISSDGGHGGAIRLQGDDSTLNLNNSELCYNVSTYGDGGAICVVGSDARANINNSKIHHNSVIDSGDYGGAIYMEDGYVYVNGSNISYNSTAKLGGAVYVDAGVFISDANSSFGHNQAGKEGGAFYIDSGADQVIISGKIYGNFAYEEGGAIYVNTDGSGTDGVTVTQCEILGNSSFENGGGIYVDSDDDINLTGKVIITSNSPNNLYIRSEDAFASVYDMHSDSRIGISTSWIPTSDDPVEVPNQYRYFFPDDKSYKTAGNSDGFYFVDAGSPNLQTYTVNGVSYPINSGHFMYLSYNGNNISSKYFYSDGYFATSPRYYNDHLSTMSLSLSMAVMTPALMVEFTEEAAAKNIVDLFKSMGYTDIFIHLPKPKFYGKDGENISTIGYVIAKRTVVINGVEQTIIAVAVRGGGYADEWGSNVLLGAGTGEALGFCDAANQLENGLNSYLQDHNIDTSSSKFWLAGYSRGGAVANLVGKRLTDQYGEENVYAYTFSTPRGGVYSERVDGIDYLNLHAVINRSDFVPFVGPSEMGFIRYGIEHFIPLSVVGSDEYEAQRAKMLSQLYALSSGLIFDDEFREASVEYITGYTGITDFISPNYFTDYDHAEYWLYFLIAKLQEYSFTSDVEGSRFNHNSQNWSGYRAFWSEYTWYIYESNGNLYIKCYENAPSDFDNGNYVELTLEDAVSKLMGFYFSQTPEEQEKLISAIDPDALMKNLSLYSIYKKVIGEWDDFDINKKNEWFNKIWNDSKIGDALSKVIKEDELDELKMAFYVVADVLLDFVSEDYDQTDQDILGTFLYNIGNIFGNHRQDIAFSWVRSMDTFYNQYNTTCPHLSYQWLTVKEPTENEYGVMKGYCNHCKEEHYKTIPALSSGGAGALIGSGSIIAICTLLSVMIAGGVVTLVIVKRKKDITHQNKE